MFSRLRAFLAGRYGPDQLTFAIIILAILFNLAARFVLYWPFTGVSALLYVIAVLRMFSRNYPARRSENARFMRIFYRIRGFFFRMKARMESRRTYRFFKCPGCKNTLRVPKGRGRIRITCPKCGERFEKKT